MERIFLVASCEMFWGGKQSGSVFSPLQEPEELLLINHSSSLLVTGRLMTADVEKDSGHVIRAAFRCFRGQIRADSESIKGFREQHVRSAT